MMDSRQQILNVKGLKILSGDFSGFTLF